MHDICICIQHISSKLLDPLSPLNDAIRIQCRPTWHMANDMDRAIDTINGQSEVLQFGTGAIIIYFVQYWWEYANGEIDQQNFHNPRNRWLQFFHLSMTNMIFGNVSFCGSHCPVRLIWGLMRQTQVLRSQTSNEYVRKSPFLSMIRLKWLGLMICSL